jgi:hypothetical protein
MLSTAETIVARIALENVLAKLTDEQERKSINEAVANTIAGKAVATTTTEGEPDADAISNR